ncbi:MAG: FAD-dependent oxidoreductase [Rhodobacteraceae bacterium]|nr:FAD-dependent oxidoreductase [Paracoccaceae bacterium]
MAEGGFTFDEKPIATRPGQSIAAALTEAGIRAFRATAKDARRGMFCGMGVCQDCLVTVDGTPNVRACLTTATDGLRVETQVAFPSLDAAAANKAPAPARIMEPEVLVIGGGAGGLSAAISARQAGASVVVLDERKVPGGQYFKQSADGAGQWRGHPRRGRGLGCLRWPADPGGTGRCRAGPAPENPDRGDRHI